MAWKDVCFRSSQEAHVVISKGDAPRSNVWQDVQKVHIMRWCRAVDMNKYDIEEDALLE